VSHPQRGVCRVQQQGSLLLHQAFLQAVRQGLISSCQFRLSKSGFVRNHAHLPEFMMGSSKDSFISDPGNIILSTPESSARS
jgi:hypothetical protein